jgi:glycosyltransferase involved in cell wall biosynthesis
MTRPVLICFAGDVWDGNPHSRHHLMRRFAGRFEVLFVEGIPMRAPTTSDRFEWRRAAAKLRAGVRLRTVAPHLYVLRPLPVPPGRAQVATLRLQVEYALRRLRLGGPRLTWFSLPNVAPLRGRLGERGSVLYYQDRYDAFSHVDAGRLRAGLRALAAGCDVAFASAGPLADDLRALGADPVLVPHGVDVDRFAGRHAAPADLDGLARPLVGYIGIVDDYLSQAALLAVANNPATGTLVLVGGANADVARLDAHPRVRLLGRRPYEAIPAYLQAFACCLIPFSTGRLTEAVNPIKLREYLAAGRPVVSTPLPEVEPYGDVVALAPEADFAAAVARQLDPANDTEEARARRRGRIEGESWDAVAARIEPHLWRVVREAPS